MRRRVALITVIAALLVAEQLCVAAEVDVTGGGGGVVRRRSLHQPFFPIEWSPPPPTSGSDVVPPPPPTTAAAASTTAGGGGGRSSTSVVNTVAIALSAGLVTLAVASYSCCLLLRRRREDGEVEEDDRAVKRPVGAVAARVPSDVGSSSRQHRSPPPSSTASDAIYLDPLTTLVEVRQHEQSPDLRPLPLLKQPSPDLRPLPPLKRPESQPPPPPPATPPLTTTGYSTDEEDQATYYTAPKTAMSSFSRSTSQHSTLEQTAMPPTATATAASAPPQANPLRPARPPPPPPPPRQRLLRPLPAESPPLAALANLELTSSPVDPSVQDRGGDNSGSQSGGARPPKPPHLKPLHWDKLRAISGRTTVWDQVKNSDTFRVDEEAMESLFLNSSGRGGGGSSDTAARRVGSGRQESRLLDPKRLQNVAIMLKSLNVTADEVIGALVRGTPEDLRSEFYETLAKMAPTKEEELRLKGYSGDQSKIDPAERFLKDVLVVPFAFERVDAMLYRVNFDNEVSYLRKSFGTLEAACEELRSSKLFLKLLDAVLKTGNRMNDGTNRGEARAFKLDTLLKLADIKSTDGRTTLLHFVVKEIIRSEGFDSDQGAVNPGSGSKEQFKKDGLKLLAGLSSELSNVKRAATLEMDTLSGNILRLEADLEKVKLVVQLKETCSDEGSSENFFQSIDVFLRRAGAEIETMKTAEKNALRLVRETTEYFHGDTTKEEPHPLRIFMVVDEFLVILDRVCRDVGRTPERVMMGSGKAFRVTAGTSLPPRRHENRRVLSSSDEDSSSS
ncbi:formin-like protein 13 [Oryza brachyantha]|uniref:formin-like protein 13 n=1 Tax=Oryza brachyantha TaxID=4533 RepID=UPI001ADC64E7|nr:formin-like protein 13 [Oryza brachyantha]